MALHYALSEIALQSHAPGLPTEGVLPGLQFRAGLYLSIFNI
jgi:hypothetical protein